jgi:hypothetical protein
MPKPARTAFALREFLHHFKLWLQHRHDDQLCEAQAGFDQKGFVAAVPAGYVDLSLIIGVDEADEVAAGQKAFTLRSLPGTPLLAPRQPFLASADGFSLHAGVAAGADERQKVERLCRYIARPAIAEGRLSLTAQGQVRYTLKTPYRDGTTHVVFEPLDFMARLAALVPRPRVHLTRYHGVFAPHSRWRAEVTPAGRGKPKAPDLRTPAERHRAMTWAQRLKRVFGIEIETCEQCGGKVKVIASIEDPTVIGRILGHLASRELPAGSRPPSRGPPQGELGFP